MLWSQWGPTGLFMGPFLTHYDYDKAMRWQERQGKGECKNKARFRQGSAKASHWKAGQKQGKGKGKHQREARARQDKGKAGQGKGKQNQQANE